MSSPTFGQMADFQWLAPIDGPIEPLPLDLALEPPCPDADAITMPLATWNGIVSFPCTRARPPPLLATLRIPVSLPGCFVSVLKMPCTCSLSLSTMPTRLAFLTKIVLVWREPLWRVRVGARWETRLRRALICGGTDEFATLA